MHRLDESLLEDICFLFLVSLYAFEVYYSFFSPGCLDFLHVLRSNAASGDT